MNEYTFYMITSQGRYLSGYNRQLTIKYSASGVHQGELRFNELVDGVNIYFDKYYFKLSLFIFIIGFILQSIGFIVETEKSNQ